MNGHDLIVIGGSAGSIEGLITIARELPGSLPAAVCVVVHMPQTADSLLPHILSRAGAMPATAARDGELILPGHIYVAPANRHLIIDDGCFELSHGPKENHSRPAVDPLFRTAAAAHNGRVVGVVLSGNLSDGSLGLAEVKARGGIAIVQDPHEAQAPSMPVNAMRAVKPDYVLPVKKIACKLVELASDAPDGRSVEMVSRPEEISDLTCPDCGGVLRRSDHANAMRFTCRIGHVYEAETLLAQRADAAEDLVWSAIRALQEEGDLARHIAEHLLRSDDAGSPASKEVEKTREILLTQSEVAAGRAARIRSLLENT